MDLTGAKILTVRQPWAWAIAWGPKTTENRSQFTWHTGPLLIHAGKAWSDRGARDPRIVDALTRAGLVDALTDPPDRDVFDLGAVIAVAELTGCHAAHECCEPWGETSYSEATGRIVMGVVHWTLDKITPIPNPVPCRGRLGVTTPPAHVVDAVAEQLA